MSSQVPATAPAEDISSIPPDHNHHETTEGTTTSTPLKSTTSGQLSDAPPSYVDPKGDMTLKTGEAPRSNQQNLNPTSSQPKPKQPPETQIPNYVINLPDLGEEPDWIDCPYCKSRQKTRVSHPDSSATTLAGLFCCLFCGVITVCIPCLCHWFAETDHHCSGCNRLVAHKPHDGQMEARLPPPPTEDKYKPSQYHGMSQEERRKIEGGVENGQSNGTTEKEGSRNTEAV